jgi:hypothetical protein
MRQHTSVSLTPGRTADFTFLNEMGALMVWGTAILFFDCIIMILLYERSRSWFRDRIFPLLAFCGVLVLTFDQVAFFAGLHMLTGAGADVLVGGWIAKMAQSRSTPASQASICCTSSGRSGAVPICHAFGTFLTP